MDERPERMDHDRVPPQDLDAEQATLGAMLLGGEATARVAEFLRPADFYRDVHGAICQACQDLFSRGEPIDIVTVSSELRSRDKLEAVGGMPYLDRLMRSTPYSTNVERYASIVKEKSILRQLLFAAQGISAECYNPEATARETLDRAEAEILQLAQTRTAFDFEHIKSISERVYQTAEDKFYHGGEISGVPTGYPDLDRVLAGLQRGDLIVLAARPSMGKTSLAVCFALNAATQRDNPVPAAIFSLEMSKEQLVSGMICTEARVNLARWRTGRFRNQDWTQIAESMNKLAKAPLFIDDSPGLSPLEMRAKARRLMAEQKLGLIVVDYLQLMSGSRRYDNRVNEVSEITRSLKGLAKELDVPVVALSQLSRGVEGRQDKRPMLSDLRESGQIEADADVVMFLYRDAYYRQKAAEEEDGHQEHDLLDDSVPPDETEVIIAKQRSGPTGTVRVGFLRQFKLFVNLETADYG